MSTTLTTAAKKAIGETEIKDFATAWFDALDVHAPLEQCYSMVAETGLNMQYPDGAIRNFEAFKKWYTNVIAFYFDEAHNVQSVKATIQDDEAKADVVVGWQASWFPAPAPKSKRTSLNAYQRWKVRRSDRNKYGLEIVECIVDRFEYAPGFAQL